MLPFILKTMEKIEHYSRLPAYHFMAIFMQLVILKEVMSSILH